MRLSSWQRIIKTNFEEKYQQMIEILAFNINNAMDSLFDVLNRKVSIKDNIYCVVKDVDVKVDSKGIPKPSVGFSSDLATLIQGLSVINVLNLDNPKNNPPGGININFTQNGNTVNINSISGLYSGSNPLSDKFRIKLIAWG